MPSLVTPNSCSAKSRRHADAAVRGGIAGQRARVQRDPGPGDALHVRHGGIVVEVGVVLHLLLQDAVDAGRRLVAGPARGNWRPHDPAVGVVEGDALAAERHHRQHRRARRPRLDDGLGLRGAGVLGRSRTCNGRPRQLQCTAPSAWRQHAQGADERIRRVNGMVSHIACSPWRRPRYACQRRCMIACQNVTAFPWWRECARSGADRWPRPRASARANPLKQVSAMWWLFSP